jgi:hypothetical protein
VPAYLRLAKPAILRRLDLEGRELPPELEGFIDRHVGQIAG